MILQPGTKFTGDQTVGGSDGNKTATIKFSWDTKVQKTELRMGSPDGTVVAQSGASGAPHRMA